ncbi:EpsG family protein [Acinetobacter schindleri]|uniref:EpsG family protein n=1 Tax=Acinetobacter schindleri TaxID=108981 RepID=UPI0021CDB3C8|nr:EpsG family protein [Acinetobacter schindleri]MCU4323685.1 EpsG family protein [Acinetobacter schindleri]
MPFLDFGENMVYILTGLSLAFFSLIRVIARYNVLLVEYFFILILVLLATFRAASVGADTSTYTSFFINSPDIFHFDKNYLSYMEIGFRIYLALIKTFTSNVVIFYLVSSIITIIPVYVGLKKLKLKYSIIGLLFFLLIFYIPYPLNAFRQAVAMALFIYSLQYFYNNEIFKVIIITILAILFHNSGIFILLSYLIYSLNLKKSIIFSLLLCFLLFFIYYFNFIQYLIFNLGNVDSDVYSRTYSESTSIVQYLYRMIFLVLMGFFIFKIENDFIKKIFLIYFFGFMIFISLSANNMIATRFNMFFRILEVVLFPVVIESINNKFSRIIYFIVVLIIAFSVFYQTSFLPENLYLFR